jgi:phage baseplate assembly protein gpV
MVTLIEAVVRDQLRSFRTAELGVVTAVYSHESGGDKNNYAADVKLRNSELELKRVPLGTGRLGSVAIPNPDDVVLLQFIDGQVENAVVTTRLYSDADRPPVAKAREFVYISPDDPESGIRRVYFEFPNGNKVTLDDDKLLFDIGQTTVTINNGGDVEISSEAKLTIKTKGNASIQADGDLELKATGDVKIEGMNASLKGQTAATLEGSVSAKVKGAMVTIAGQTDFSQA